MKLRPFLLAALLALVFASAHAASVSILYKRDSDSSVGRLDTAAQSTLQALEEKLIEGGFQVIQPDAKLYARLDQARGVLLTFSREAGLTVTVDASKGVRPNPGTDSTWAEVRLRVKLYSGPRVLASLSSFGAVAYRGNAQERAYEVAAKRAVEDLGEKLLKRLEDAPAQEATPAAPALVVPQDSPAPSEAQILPAKGRKWALMVGVQDFSLVRKANRGAGQDLPGVAVDMKAVRAALADLGVDASRLIWLYNEQATTANVRAAFRTLKESVGKDDLVYIYLSTHGMSKEGGLSRFGIPITYDFRPDNFMDFEQFRAAIAALPAENIIWLNDTCHSGLATEGLLTVEVGARDFGIAPPSAFDAATAADLKDKNVVVLSSATGDQQAADLGEKGGLFSSVLSAGVRDEIARRRPLPSIYGFYKEHLDGKVQAGFRELCAGKDRPAICRRQDAQQPVFAAQRDGKALRM